MRSDLKTRIFNTVWPYSESFPGMSRTDFSIFSRTPKFPVVGFADKVLFSALELSGLASILVRFEPSSGKDKIQVVDSNGEEFWYFREQCILAPGFTIRRWTKQQIIDLYNSNVESDRIYGVRSLSSKRLSEIVSEISKLIRSP